MPEEIPADMDGAEELSEFDRLMQESQQGEVIQDPAVGKHEDAILVSAEFLRWTDNGNAIVGVTWGNITSQEGEVIEVKDTIWCPDENTRPKGQLMFLQKLKNLEVIPQHHKAMFYCTTQGAVETLVRMLQAKVGQAYPISISANDQGFLNVSVRMRPKPRE